MTKANKIDIGDQTNKKWVLKKHCYINIAHTKKKKDGSICLLDI